MPFIDRLSREKQTQEATKSRNHGKIDRAETTMVTRAATITDRAITEDNKITRINGALSPKNFLFHLTKLVSQSAKEDKI